MNKQDCIITITDGISPTSMPFNEFLLYRLTHYPKEKQILIQVFEKGIDPRVSIPKDVEYYSVGMNIAKLNKIVRYLEKKYNIKAFHIHEGKSVILFSIATLLLKRHKILYTLHSTYRNYPFHNKLFCFIGSLMAKKIVCVSKTSYKYYPKILKLLRKQNVLAIQNGVDLDRIGNIERPITHKQDKHTITYVARLVPLKRHHLLIDIISQLPNVRLELIGSGPLEEELKQYANKNGISDRISFLGLLPREQVFHHLYNTDIYVSTSSYEGLPIGLLEAMACGAVCVVTDIDQHVEIAEKCKSLITLSADIPTWVRKLKQLISMNREDLSIIGDSNKNKVRENFSLESMHENYSTIYTYL